MFGKNKQLKQQKKEEYNNSINIKEIFYTIQGEGPFSGRPAVFIRFGNCHLKCNFCDTDFESNLKRLDVLQILEKIKEKSPVTCKFIVITGGEPFLQYGLTHLVKKLLTIGYFVQIETAGSLYLNLQRHKNLMIVISPKTPKLHPKLESHSNLSAYKYIISKNNLSKDDGLPDKCPMDGNLKLARPQRRDIPIIIQPCDEYDSVKNKENLMTIKRLSLKYNYIASVQLHKYLNIA